MTIRHARPTDLDALDALEQQCFPPEEAATRTSFAQRLAVFPEHFWLAEEDGQILACVNGCVSDSPLLQDEMFEDAGLHNEQGAWQMLFGVETHPTAQGKGYASALMRQMIADAKAHKIDLIITKSVSRFARNVQDFLGAVRDLTEQKPPVGIFFESEAIFSLNEDSQLALTFQSTMAEEESHTRSRSMESSLRMRLDNGLPLTPPLLGYNQNADGGLEINPDEKNTVKLAFFMYLSA